MQYNPDLLLSTQKAFLDGFVKIGAKYRNTVLLTANQATSSGTQPFLRAFPERHFNFGNGIENMFGAAAGFTIRGKVPFVVSYALSATGKSWDNIRNLICVPNITVIIIGTHAGLLRAEEGMYHQSLEDIALMRSLPDMKVVCPADATETKKVLETVMMDYGPTYIRLVNVPLPDLYDSQHQFVFGRGHIYKQGTDVCIFSYGTALHMALEAASVLDRDGISTMVVNMASIAPIDKDLIEECARQIPRLVTVEDHQTVGGLGSAVAEVLSERYPAKLLRLGMEGYGESGKVDDLFKKYRMDGSGIAERVRVWAAEKV